MNSREATVGVIVPTYNAERTIGETLASISRQAYQNLDIVVVDDGSSDGSAEIVAGWAKRDERIRLLRQENAGVAAARNAGAAHTDASYLSFIDADDLWAPDKIAAQMALLMQEGQTPVLVYCWFAHIDARSRTFWVGAPELIEGRVMPQICRENFVGNGSSVLVPREIFERVGGFDPSLRIRQAQGCEDLLFVALAARHYEFKVVPRHLVGYRVTDENMSSDTLRMLRSFDLVAARLTSELPQYAGEWDEHRKDFILWLARRAAMAGRYENAMALIKQLRPHQHKAALGILPKLAEDYIKAKLVPGWVKSAAARNRPRAPRIRYHDLTW